MMPEFILLTGDEPTDALTKESVIEDYREWQRHRHSRPTANSLCGQFYSLYRRQYGMLPLTAVAQDVTNFQKFLELCQEQPDIAPACIEVFFSPEMRAFNNLNSASFINLNVLNGWGIFEKARKLKRVHGEQAEYHRNREYGVRYV